MIAAIFSVISFPFIPVNGILNAHEKFVQLKTCDVIHRVLVILANTICLICGLGLYALVSVNAIAGILMIIAKLLCIKYFTSQEISWKYSNKAELKEIASYSGWATVIALSQRCIFSLSPSILGMLSGSTEIAILSIAITLENFTYTFASAINGMFLPTVSRIITSDKRGLLPLMVKVGRIQIYIICLVVFGFTLVGQDFVKLWVGDSFSEGYLCTVLLIIPSAIHLPQLVGLDAIYAANKIKKLAVVYIFMATINIAGAFLLAKRLGATGICLSICFAYLFRTIGMDIIFKKDLEIDISVYFKSTFGKLLFPLLLLTFVFYIVYSYIESMTWGMLLIKVIIYTFAYLLLIYFILMNKEEKSLILAPLHRIFNF